MKTPASAERYPTALYESAFPRQERRDTAAWTALLDAGRVKLFAPSPDTLLTYWELDGFDYVEHFAVDASQRSRGLGSALLGRFVAGRGTRPVVLEVEPADVSPLAARRIGFYRRNGFHLIERPYLQPPYRPGDAPLPLSLMTTRPEAVEARFEAIVRSIHLNVYGYEP